MLRNLWQWIGNRTSQAPHRRRSRRSIRGLAAIECLEDRCLLSGTTGNYLIAFTSAVNLTLDGDERGGIMIMRPDGSGLRQITTFHTLNYDFGAHGLNLPDDHPAFSPDGTQIVFTSSRDDDSGLLQPDNFEIYVMDVNGANVRRLTTEEGLDTEPVFSPDGTKIAFASERSGNLDIWVMNADGSDPRQITTNSKPEIEPAWSPDGSQIVFTRVESTLGGVAFNQKNIYVVNADGTGERQLTSVLGEEHDATFSPDGTELVITSEQFGAEPFGDVVRIRVADGAVLANLTADANLGGGDPAWSPDGSQVAYFKATLPVITSAMQLFVMDSDGSNKVHLDAPGLLNIHPNWGIEVDSDGDGRPDYLENANVSLGQGEFATTHAAGDHFGAAVALADLTHDGFPELIVGAPGEDRSGVINAGRIALVHGSAQGPDFGVDVFSTGNILDLLPSSLDAEEVGGTLQPHGRFGQTMVSGDFNGDGFTDLAVGAPGQNQVFVAYSSITQWQVLNGSGSFGAALAAGDFNNDGRMDLAVGAPDSVVFGPLGVFVPAGSVRVFYGSAAGLSPNPQIFDQGSLPAVAGAGAEEAGDRFGATLAAGDMNGDGAWELAVGVPGEDLSGVADAGLVHILPGRSGQTLALGQAVARDARSLPLTHKGLQASARFGEVLAMGDFNGDILNVADLVVGIPRQDIGTTADAGLVAVFKGLTISSSLLSDTATAFGLVDVGGGTGGVAARFGQTLAVGDFTGDGADDLAISAPLAGVARFSGAGRVYIVLGSKGSASACQFCAPINPLFGSGGGLVPAAAQQIQQVNVGAFPEVGDRFGASLLFPSGNTMAADDLDGDGQDDLFIGSPHEDLAGQTDSGLVSIRYGIKVGTFDVTPLETTVASGERVTFTLEWTHPDRWRDLETLHFRIADEEGVLFWLRFDVQTRTFSLFDPQTGTFGPGVGTGTPAPLTTAGIVFDPAASTVEDSGPDGGSLSLSLSLWFREPLVAGEYRIEVMATDLNGNSQGFELAGMLHFVNRRNRRHGVDSGFG